VILISVDPGVRHAGIAIFAAGVLTTAFLVKEPSAINWASVCEVAYSAVYDAGVTNTKDIEGVVEIPQAYRGSPVPPGTLIDLAAAAGAIRGAIGGVWTMVYPRVWKKQVPKAIMNTRILERLSPDERSRISLPKNKARQTDVIDAIGIGLYKLNRL
jgi:hypothetical protein